MSAFIRTIQGEIFGIDRNKKHFSLAIEEILSGTYSPEETDRFLAGSQCKNYRYFQSANETCGFESGR
jgi:hypothetical protein